MLVIATFLVSYMQRTRGILPFALRLALAPQCINVRRKYTFACDHAILLLTATSLADASNKIVMPKHAWDTQTKYQLDCNTAIQFSIFNTNCF